MRRSLSKEILIRWLYYKAGLGLFILVARLCAAQVWGPVSADFVFNGIPNGQTAGTTMTLSIMTSSSQTSTCNLSTTCTWTAGGEGTGNPALISNFSVAANQDACSNLGLVTLNNSSTTFPAQSMNYQSTQFDATNSAQAGLHLPSGITQISTIMCLQTPVFTNNGSDWDLQDYFSTNGYFSVAQINPTACGSPASLANYCIRLEQKNPSTVHSPPISLAPQTTYIISHYYNFTTGQGVLNVYTTSGALFGTTTITTTPPGGDTGATFTFGNGESNSTSTPYFFNWFLINWTSASTNFFWANSAPQAPILSPARTTLYASAGVSGGIPNRTNVCSTASLTSTTAQVNTLISNCSTAGGGVVVYPAGTVTGLTSAPSLASLVTLRGAGANLTFFPTGVGISLGGGTPNNGPVAVTGFPYQGQTQLTLASVANLKVGNPMVFTQLDPTCDNGGPLVAGTGSSYTCTAISPGIGGPYSEDGGRNNTFAIGGSCGSTSPANCASQIQYVTVTQCGAVVTPGASCTGTNVLVTFSPGLHMTNWSFTGMFALWATNPVLQAGVEDINFNMGGANNPLTFNNCQDCWIKGVEVQNTAHHVINNYSLRSEIRNSYFFLTPGLTTGNYGVDCESSSDMLVVNNIFHAVVTPMISNGACDMGVYLYNYEIGSWYTGGGSGYSEPGTNAHAAGTDMCLSEGNISDGFSLDNIHGTANFCTAFRNWWPVQPACWSSGASFGSLTTARCTGGVTTIQNYSMNRFSNYVGNIGGTSGTITNYCNGGSTCPGSYTATNNNFLGDGYGNGGPPTDPNVDATMFRWGNADTATGLATPRFNCNELMAGSALISIAAVQQPYYGLCPSNDTLPASLYYTSTPSWWPAGKPWPLIGPDVSGGNIRVTSGGTYDRSFTPSSIACPSGGTCSQAANGYVNSNPAFDAYYTCMGGDPYGIAGPYPFNEATCYGGAPPVITNGVGGLNLWEIIR